MAIPGRASSGVDDGRSNRRLSSLTKVVLTAGAVAGALGSILALGTTVGSWFEGEADKPEGTVRTLKLQSVRPLTYGEWRSHEGLSSTGVPEPQLRIPGKLITYDVDTRGYAENTKLPVRLIVHDTTHSRSRTIEADPLKVVAGDDCGCFDWVAVPRGRTRYYLEVAVFPPGPIKGQPLKTAATEYFQGS